MKRFKMDRDIQDLVKSIKRFEAGRGDTIHFGFRDRFNDYIYFTTQNGVTEFDMKHPLDYGCTLHFSNLKMNHMLYIAECMKSANRKNLGFTNQDIFEILTEEFGLEY